MFDQNKCAYIFPSSPILAYASCFKFISASSVLQKKVAYGKPLQVLHLYGSNHPSVIALSSLVNSFHYHSESWWLIMLNSPFTNSAYHRLSLQKQNSLRGLTMGDIGALAYLRLPSFMKRFSEDHSMDELVRHLILLSFWYYALYTIFRNSVFLMKRVPPEFVATHGDELPFDCRLVMSRGGRGWPVRLLKIASGCHFRVGWPEFRIINRIVQDDVFVFTMVQPGIFHVKGSRRELDAPLWVI